jgi:RimJ/RimL family protein N-acetyltransferase/GNAT superfamily N-acetyltransferase
VSSASPYPRRLRTSRLALRAPVETDRPLWVRLHRDPALYRYAPYAIAPSDDAASEHFDEVLSHWDEHGFGYQVVDRPPREGTVPESIGVGGLRAEGDAELNLYYRFSAGAQGEGYAREAARAWVAAGVEHLDGTVTAVAKEHNLASVRTALAAGLGRAGTRVEAGEPRGTAPSLLLKAPRVEVLRQGGFTQATRRDILDLWCRVTRAGGAVGFLPTESRDAHAAALSAHEDQMRTGLATAVLVRDPDAPGDPAVAALGWWVREPVTLLAHRRTAYRVMTDPDKRGRNLGRILMAAMHRAARDEGVEIVTLGVRGGMGLEGFYERCGYREVGRVPGGIRVAAGEDRDDITMARRLT